YPNPASESQENDDPGRWAKIDGETSAAMVPRSSPVVTMPSLRPSATPERQPTDGSGQIETDGDISAAMMPRVSPVVAMPSLRPSPTVAREFQQTGPGRTTEMDGEMSAVMVP